MKPLTAITAVVLSLTLMLGGCTHTTATTRTPNSSTAATMGFRSGATMSNLNDAESQAFTRRAFADAGIPTENIDSFFRNVEEYNSVTSFPNSGFVPFNTENSTYDLAESTGRWLVQHPIYPGTNCRINSFILAEDFLTIGDVTHTDTAGLFVDYDGFNHAPTRLINPADKPRFDALFSRIRTTADKNSDRHRSDIEKHFSDHGINFHGSTASLVTVFMRDNLEEHAFLFAGHAGITVPVDKGVLFVEKLAFDQPYQAIIFRNKKQLHDYLLSTYDVGEDQEYGRPVIFENTQPMQVS